MGGRPWIIIPRYTMLFKQIISNWIRFYSIYSSNLPSAFHIWFKPLELFALDGIHIYIICEIIFFCRVSNALLKSKNITMFFLFFRGSPILCINPIIYRGLKKFFSIYFPIVALRFFFSIFSQVFNALLQKWKRLNIV